MKGLGPGEDSQDSRVRECAPDVGISCDSAVKAGVDTTKMHEALGLRL